MYKITTFLPIAITQTINIIENDMKNVTNTDEIKNKNHTDRTRRLIPYMTYYLPSHNGYVNNQYSVSTLNPQFLYNDHRYNDESEQPEEQPQNIQYQNNYVNYNYYKNIQQQRSPFVYNNHHQAQQFYNKAPNANIPQQFNHYQDSKKHITPFLSSNKVPGLFRPMTYTNEDDNLHKNIDEHQDQTQPDNKKLQQSSRPQLKHTHQYHQEVYQFETPAYTTHSDYNPKHVTHNENTKYISQNIQQPKYVKQGPVQNFLSYIKTIPTTKSNAYGERIQNRIPETQTTKNPIEYQNSNDYIINRNPVEYGVKNQEPYYQQPLLKQTSVPEYSPIVSTTIAPLIHASSIGPYETQQRNQHNHKYQTVHKQSTPAPTQYLTETTQQHKPYYIQHTNPLYVKSSAKYLPPTKASTTPKIIITTTPSYSKYEANSLADILKKLQDSNHLPQTLTPDNIDNSIKTLVKILNDLKNTQKIVEKPQPQPPYKEEDEYYDTDTVEKDVNDPIENNVPVPGPNTGRPGIDYPALHEIPETSFNCKDQRYKGFFGDPETNCQVWHYCDLNGGQSSFLCPNGTIFSQVALTCDWWFNVKCSSTAQLYVLNERLYKYILPFTPKFPEDYSGPLVDKYLALKFEEMEEKMRKQKKGKGNTDENKSGESEQEHEQEDEEDMVDDTHQTNLDDIEGIQRSTTESTKSDTVTLMRSHPVIPTKTTVVSEKVEVIEIKSDGSSGHIIPSRV